MQTIVTDFAGEEYTIEHEAQLEPVWKHYFMMIATATGPSGEKLLLKSRPSLDGLDESDLVFVSANPIGLSARVDNPPLVPDQRGNAMGRFRPCIHPPVQRYLRD